MFSDEDKANALADNFEKVHHLTRDYSDENTEREVDRVYSALEQTEIDVNEIDFTSPREIAAIIAKFKPKKAPGMDGIQNIVLKNLPRKAIVLLTNIFNACLRRGYFPKEWKIAKVLAFRKPGKDKLFPQNYRPISLLCTTSKILEKIILNRIHKHEEVHQQLIDEQFGFRENRSTTQQLARLTDFISNSFNIKHTVAIAFLDMEKAFDTVWRKGLIFKLHKLNQFKIYLLKILMSYLKDRSFFISVNDTISSVREAIEGVPQGSLVGPVLYVYFTNDVPSNARASRGVFADDTSIFAASRKKDLAIKRINEYANEMIDYYYKWKIKVNYNKTELLMASNHDREPVSEVLELEGNAIDPKNDVKYLGVTLDRKLSFTSHINNVRKKANAALALLYNLMNRRSKLSTKNKILMYKMLIRPIIIYGAPIWGNTCASNIRKLETIQSKILRMIAQVEPRTSNKVIRRKLGVSELYPEIKRLTSNFYNVQLRKVESLASVATYTKETAPFHIKYKLPHQLLLGGETL